MKYSAPLKQDTLLHNNSYRIIQVLGQGSFGITYLAEHVRLKKQVAIKEFFMGEVNSRKDDGTTVEGSTGSVFTDYRRKFRKEAENLANLRHANIVNVSDIFDENGTSYYVMDFIEGINLDKYISVNGRLSEKEAIEITLEIGKALEYMHSKGMLHLDIKPSNIMRGIDGKCYLIDFGLSKQFTKDGKPEETTSIGLGTPGYAPIEQSGYRQEGTFPATLDVYALGATLFKMVTGHRPPLASEILNSGFPDDELNLNNISRQTGIIIKKLMHPIWKHRPQNMTVAKRELNLLSNSLEKKNNGQIKRPIAVTVVLWIILVAYVLWTTIFALSIYGMESENEILSAGLTAIFGLGNVLGSILLLKWNRIGFLIMIISTLLDGISDICLLNSDSLDSFIFLTPIVVLFILLQIKKNGISYWKQLKSGWDGKNNRHLYQATFCLALLFVGLTLTAIGNDEKDGNDNPDEEYVVIEEVMEESIEEKSLRLLTQMIEEENKKFPQKLEEGVIITKSVLDDDYVTYLVECDEDILDMDLLRNNKSYMKDSIKKNLLSDNPAMKFALKIYINANKGIAYRYVGDTSGDSFTIKFPISELKDL